MWTKGLSLSRVGRGSHRPVGVCRSCTRRSQRGAFLVLLVISLPAILAITSLAIDVGWLYERQHHIQVAADAGAIAGGHELLRGDVDEETLEARVRAVVDENCSSGYGDCAATTLDVDVEHPPPAGDCGSSRGGNNNFVAVRVSQPVDFLWGIRTQDVVGCAVARIETAQTTCVVHSCDDGCEEPSKKSKKSKKDEEEAGVCTPSKSRVGIDVKKSARLVAKGCDIVVDSVSEKALLVDGDVSANDGGAVFVVGDASGDGTIYPSPQTLPESSELVGCDVPTDRVCEQPDGLENREVPKKFQKFEDGCEGVEREKLFPGIYADKLTIDDNKSCVELQPGVYVLNQGMSIEHKANVVGDGVTFIDQSPTGKGFTISPQHGGGQVSLSAPESGNCSGYLFFQGYGDDEPEASKKSTKNKITKSKKGVLKLTGEIFLPSEVIEMKKLDATDLELSGLTAYKISVSGGDVEVSGGPNSASGGVATYLTD